MTSKRLISLRQKFYEEQLKYLGISKNVYESNYLDSHVNGMIETLLNKNVLKDLVPGLPGPTPVPSIITDIPAATEETLPIAITER